MDMLCFAGITITPQCTVQHHCAELRRGISHNSLLHIASVLGVSQSNKSTINHDGPASMVADVGGPYEAESPPTAENGGFIESPTPQVNDRWRRSPRGGQKVAQKGQRSKGLSLLPLAHLVFINTIEQ